MRVAQVVLIEDNPADVLLVRLALKESGIEHDLIEFKSGADACKSLCQPNGQLPVDPDAILLDLSTPRMDGIEVITNLRTQFPPVPITIVTSSHARADKLRAELHGVDYLE